MVCLALVAMSLVATSASADPRFYGGARGSFSMSDVDATLEHDPRFGVGGGVYVAGTAWKSLDLRVEANYTQKGARLAFSRSSYEWQMDYLEIPFMLVVNLMPKSQTSVEFCAGMTYAFPLQRSIEVGDNVGYHLEDFIDDPIFVNPTTNIVPHSVADSDVGFALGMGLSVPTGKVNFTVDVRFTRSLTDPAVEADYVQTAGQGEDAVTTITSANFSNRVFTFFVGFAFPFGSRTPAEAE